MAGIKIDFRIDDERVMRALGELNQRGRDAQPAMAAIGEDLDRATRDRFDEQVSPSGDPWEPLSEGYRKRKPKRQDEILVLNGHLRDTLRYDAGPDYLEFGTDRKYGATHHFGDDERGIPERSWLGFSSDDEENAIETLLDYMGEPLGE
ncbi:phage virion morphogenesis (putative tail completion) protein [Vreelandella subterranea]|uniref:Phage virion morphogenesis (Putative tail completion) protein n=1 Tax=Vreelandella subterranea TaxID=416874 RepID=A0A1H9VST0_9GAMM|nr:phage virion morphogenesis protein [Halomonas subterranea]SES24601.1 phage virion morphogenesis (putative tail completion) protein [Halomonas subterranea]